MELYFLSRIYGIYVYVYIMNEQVKKNSTFHDLQTWHLSI